MEQPHTFCATSLDRLKIAALLFDRIVLAREVADREHVPHEIVFEIPEARQEMLELVTAHIPDLIERLHGATSEREKELVISQWVSTATARAVVSAHSRYGLVVTPLYSSGAAFTEDHPAGLVTAYEAVLNNLPMVTGDCDWSQVLEFRHDVDAARKFRALRTWLRATVGTASIQEATDLIATKIDDYEWAIKKHGLRTATGTLVEVLDSKTLATVALSGSVISLFTQPVIASLVAGTLLAAKAAVRLAERKIDSDDLRRGPNAAIATICEIREITRGA